MKSEYCNLWYQQNKQSVSIRRKLKYRNNPQYRQRILDAARSKSILKSDTVPAPYMYNFIQAASILGLTIHVLRYWKKNQYFPTPFLHAKSFWFTESQITLLVMLRDYFEEERYITKSTSRDLLNTILTNITNNWMNTSYQSLALKQQSYDH